MATTTKKFNFICRFEVNVSLIQTHLAELNLQYLANFQPNRVVEDAAKEFIIIFVLDEDGSLCTNVRGVSMKIIEEGYCTALELPFNFDKPEVPPVTMLEFL
ncbi:hypothetical protein O6H91_23G061900 [Diphasiastrum complanatum]|uniref:Uncharacterized protein n=1 Tax=Diphasiastrum complanatum TaxID=34168 RepID=A0ACC2ABC8_DIPCM|nr:hypothetical protein O6H91_23G061900 [Diphasiastrum complanatum]